MLKEPLKKWKIIRQNQHAGGGPGMSLTHPNQSYDSFRKEVGKARSEAIVVQQ